MLLRESSIVSRLQSHQDPDIDQQLNAIASDLPDEDPDQVKLMAARLDLYKSSFSKWSAARGREVFQTNCAVCHQIDGQGALVGPQLDGVWGRGAERLIEDVLLPNRNVDNAFRYSILTLDTGGTANGMLAREEGAAYVLIDATGVVPGVAAPSLALFNRLFDAISLLFFSFNLLPSFFAFLIDEGLGAAIRKPLKAICTFSPFFFVIQSRCIGHYFSNEFAVGGAKYISTGRGLAILHTPFHEIYVTHAASCIYPGLELLGLLVGTGQLAMSGGHSLNLWSVGFASITPAALLLGPSLFNPHAFGTPESILDLRRFGIWLFKPRSSKPSYDACHSWADFYQEFADSRRSVKAHAFLLPSKEMLLSLPLLLTSYVAMAPYGWGAGQVFILGTPIIAAIAIGFLIMPCVAIYAGVRHDFDFSHAMANASAFGLEKIAAGLVLFALVLETRHWETLDDMGLATMPPSLPFEHGMLLLAARYFSFRWTCNVGLYLVAGMNKRAGELIAARPENAQRQPYACLRHVPGAMCYVAALTGAAHLFLLDAMLGLSIQLAFLLVGCIPGTRRGHYAILGFSKKVREVAEEQRVDMQFSTAGTLKWLNLKNVLEREREYTARGAVRSAGASARRPTMHATVAAAQASQAAARVAEDAATATDGAQADEGAAQAAEGGALDAENATRASVATDVTQVFARDSTQRTADQDYFI